MNKIIVSAPTKTRTVKLGSASSTNTASVSKIDVRREPTVRKVRIEDAVYAHIQALKALGRDRINTTEIASALDLPVSAVARVLPSLLQRGVKIVAK